MPFRDKSYWLRYAERRYASHSLATYQSLERRRTLVRTTAALLAAAACIVAVAYFVYSRSAASAPHPRPTPKIEPLARGLAAI